MTRLLIALVMAAASVGCVAADGGRSQSLNRDKTNLFERNGQDQRRMVLSQMEHGALSEAHASWAEARSAYTNVSLRDPDDVNALIARARTFHAEGRARQAADMLEGEVRKRTRPSLELLLATGDAVMATDRPSLAVEYYEEARTLDTRDQRLRFSLFTAYILADRPEDAAQLISRVPPSELPRHLVLLAGRAALLADDVAYAATAFSTYLADRPEATDAWVDLTRARFRLEQYPAARIAVLRALALRPDHAAALVLKGHIDYVEGDLSAALRSYEMAQNAGAPMNDMRGLIERIHVQLNEQAAQQAAREAAADRTATDPAPARPAATEPQDAGAGSAASGQSLELVVPPPAWSPQAWVGTARPVAID